MLQVSSDLLIEIMLGIVFWDSSHFLLPPFF
nr:MAG TPA: hypothetical protein [Caudoviricetes sp.]